jgi:precorrin-6A/cobalt-precorrin-6A reductase
MSPNLLILGGTTEARRLADAVAQAGLRGTVSYAGRVERPYPTALPHRIGGFGGVDGLRAHLRAEGVTHVVDATHPFAAQMSANAVAACAAEGVALAALTRPAWQAGPGDDWRRLPDIAGAVAALAGPPRRVMLAVGRMHLEAFAVNPQHFYLLRLVDAPEVPPPFPHCAVEVSRGPFTEAEDRALMQRHGIELVVSKNAGGSGARAKLDAARALGLPVLMIDRPALPARRALHDPGAVLDWIAQGHRESARAHAGVNRGV